MSRARPTESKRNLEAGQPGSQQLRGHQARLSHQNSWSKSFWYPKSRAISLPLVEPLDNITKALANSAMIRARIRDPEPVPHFLFGTDSEIFVQSTLDDNCSSTPGSDIASTINVGTGTSVTRSEAHVKEASQASRDCLVVDVMPSSDDNRLLGARDGLGGSAAPLRESNTGWALDRRFPAEKGIQDHDSREMHICGEEGRGRVWLGQPSPTVHCPPLLSIADHISV
ncbi:hypothetical protein QBC39DRAFT_329233 [Podospora conica]|nr:hypothetical protein QBC39DRAFT_329233 [Schizothecium conicum]